MVYRGITRTKRRYFRRKDGEWIWQIYWTVWLWEKGWRVYIASAQTLLLALYKREKALKYNSQLTPKPTPKKKKWAYGAYHKGDLK